MGQLEPERRMAKAISGVLLNFKKDCEAFWEGGGGHVMVCFIAVLDLDGHEV